MVILASSDPSAVIRQPFFSQQPFLRWSCLLLHNSGQAFPTHCVMSIWRSIAVRPFWCPNQMSTLSISDNYAWLIPSTFVGFPHQQLATNHWHFLASTTLLLWDCTQLFWNHLLAEQLDRQRIRHASEDFLLQVLMLCLPSWPKRLYLPKNFLAITHRHQDAKELFCLDAPFCLYPEILRQFLVAYHQLACKLAVYVASFQILMLADLSMFFDAYLPV